MDEAITFDCPVCGEPNSSDPEVLQAEGEAIQDCWVCCRPLNVEWLGEGEVQVSEAAG